MICELLFEDGPGGIVMVFMLAADVLYGGVRHWFPIPSAVHICGLRTSEDVGPRSQQAVWPIYYSVHLSRNVLFIFQTPSSRGSVKSSPRQESEEVSSKKYGCRLLCCYDPHVDTLSHSEWCVTFSISKPLTMQEAYQQSGLIKNCIVNLFKYTFKLWLVTRLHDSTLFVFILNTLILFGRNVKHVQGSRITCSCDAGRGRSTPTGGSEPCHCFVC